MKERFSIPRKQPKYVICRAMKNIFEKLCKKLTPSFVFCGQGGMKALFISLSQARATEYSKARHHRMNEARRSSE